LSESHTLPKHSKNVNQIIENIDLADSIDKNKAGDHKMGTLSNINGLHEGEGEQMCSMGE
jgi:hypothetical protein